MRPQIHGFTRNTTPAAPPLASGSGAVVVDVEGREFIDCCAQTLNMNLGQCHPDVLEAVVAQARRLTFASSRFSSDVAVELAGKLLDATPDELCRINLKNTSGSSANEEAVKAARKRTGKRLVVSLQHSHLGQTLEMMRISGKHWDVPYVEDRPARFMDAPYCYRCPFGQTPDSCSTECLDDLDAIWKRDGDDLAAVMMEPIMVDAGVLVPPRRYHERVRAFCDERDIALIWDEAQTGFGWLGELFAMDYYGITPDIVSMAKGLGAGFPLAATLYREEYDVLTYGEHEITYGAHPISCAASLASLHYLQNGGVEEARTKGAYARARLQALAEKYPAIGDVRGVGLLLGIEVVDERGAPNAALARTIYREMMDRGVILRLSKVGENNSILQFKPPIVITFEQLDTVFERLEEVLCRAARPAAVAAVAAGG